MLSDNTHSSEHWMSIALEQAKLAESKGEVPVGAVIVHNNQAIATGHNYNIGQVDCTSHAEIVAIRKASQVLNNYRLIDCELYTTLEPCLMCFGAIIHARIKKLYYGASDPKTGALGGLVDITQFYQANHQVSICNNILSSKCSNLLKDFFAQRR